ncbi:Bromodomain-containing protein [Hortaea werneckii]|nr:Bromodomain-containing protein [Hortaea werneckii]
MVFQRKRPKSPSSTPVPSTEAGGPSNDGSQLPETEWNAMTDVLNNIYDYRTEDDFDPSKLFHRKVNKRVIPEYYDMIQEPIALSTIKQKIQKREYQSFTEFVRDFALIPHNAQVFNRPDSGAFQDALVIKEQLEKQLQLLVEKGTISKEVAALPYLGEIPTYEDVEMGDAGPAGAEEEESSDDDDDDDDEGEEDDDGKRKKRRGGRGGAGGARREAGDMADDGGRRARGRPPKLNTPMEARIQAILKGIRKPKDSHGQLMIRDFDRLPDKAAMPEYFAEIKNPMAYDILKRKVKRKKYQSVEDFMADVNLMFNNAKEYNTDESSIHKNATALQIEAGKLYDIEKAKPDDTFADEDGKVPMPNGILQNGELYRVGDWVHIQNPNDFTKPIPAQIYRTYKNPNGQSMVNVCWYYRPEQTVHRFDKHFFPNEVVKTGRYRDHHIEEIEGKCFIMFFTRYFKGRPRGLPEGMEIYVCEARYNEALHQFNKIKTWASCLPDEVRDNNYEMDLFEQPRRMKKFPSPIAYMLKDEQKETDDLPKVTWGAEGAPPKIGAVHRRPRGERDSPPPEPTPPPQPKPAPTPTPVQRPPPPAAPVSYASTPAQPQQVPTGTSRPPLASYTPQPSYQQSPAPRPPSAHPPAGGYGPPQTPQPPQTIAPQRPPMPAQQPSYPSQQAHAPAATPGVPPQQPTTLSSGIPPAPSTYAPRPTTASYRDPPPIEVYVLPDHANFSIPNEIREQYQRDEQGRVLFFAAPPVTSAGDHYQPADAPSTGSSGGAVGKGHSIRYLAEKARRKEDLAKKRTERDLEVQYEQRVAKKAKIENDAIIQAEVEGLNRRALECLERQLVDATKGDLSAKDLRRLETGQRRVAEQEREVEEHEVRRRMVRGVDLEGIGSGGGGFADDWDNRVIA